MSRDWTTCALCSQHFVVDWDGDGPFDVCGSCVERIESVATRRLLSAIAGAAAAVDGPARAALDAIAAAIAPHPTTTSGEG